MLPVPKAAGHPRALEVVEVPVRLGVPRVAHRNARTREPPGDGQRREDDFVGHPRERALDLLDAVSRTRPVQQLGHVERIVLNHRARHPAIVSGPDQVTDVFCIPYLKILDVVLARNGGRRHVCGPSW